MPQKRMKNNARSKKRSQDSSLMARNHNSKPLGQVWKTLYLLITISLLSQGVMNTTCDPKDAGFTMASSTDCASTTEWPNGYGACQNYTFESFPTDECGEGKYWNHRVFACLSCPDSCRVCEVHPTEEGEVVCLFGFPSPCDAVASTSI